MNIQISEMPSGVSRIVAHAAEARTWLHESPAVRRIMEILAVVSLSGLVISISLPLLSISVFSKFSLAVLLIWRFVVEYVPVKQIPRSVIILSILFFLSLLISALLSQNKYYEYFEYKAFKYFMIGGLLYTAPLREKYRKYIIVVFVLSAVLNGLAGILQYFSIMPLGNDRPHGFSLVSTFYAAQLAFAAGGVIILLAFGKKGPFESKAAHLFLLTAALLILGGIILSGSRGAWIAFAGATLITLFLYNRRSSIILIVIISIVMTLTLLFDSALRWRAASTFALPLTDVQNSQGNRLELWKGSIKIFREHPLMGVGTGDFQMHIDQLIADKRLKEMETTIHAHNIFFQTLAAQGIVGSTILSALIISLIRWGLRGVRDHNEAGEFVILFCGLLVIFSGMTDYYFGSEKYFYTCFISIGLLGPVRRKAQLTLKILNKQPALS